MTSHLFVILFVQNMNKWRSFLLVPVLFKQKNKQKKLIIIIIKIKIISF